LRIDFLAKNVFAAINLAAIASWADESFAVIQFAAISSCALLSGDSFQ
jgi:hypothetical protein